VHAHLWPILRWLGIPVTAAVTLAPGLRAGPSLDAAVFGLVGRQLVDGTIPYVGAWDHKPLGIHLVHAMADLLPGPGSWEWTWLLTLLAVCATSWLLVSMLRPMVSTPSAIMAAVGSSLGLGHFVLSLGGGLSESFAVLPATAALALVVRPEITAARAAAAGVLVGSAMAISPQLAPAGVAVLVLLATSRRRTLLGFLIGAAGPAAALLAGLAVVGALPAFADALLVYNAAYRAVAGPGIAALLPWTVLVLVPLIAPALAGLLALRRSSAQARQLGLASVAWIVVAGVLVAVQGRLYGHYAIGIVVPLAILAAIGMDYIASRVRSRPIRWATAGLGAGLVVLSLVVGAAAARMELAMVGSVNHRAAALAEWAEREDIDAEPMFVWGNAPQAYLFTDAPPVSRFGFLYPLTTPGYADEEKVAEVLAELETVAPSVVVDAGSDAPGQPGFPPLLIDRPVATDGRDLDLLDPLRAFVADRYELANTVHGWPVYRLAGEVDE